MLSFLERLAAAREANEFSDNDIALELDWLTCVTGQCDRRIPRCFDLAKTHKDDTHAALGWPEDTALYVMGLKIYDAVENHQFDRAEILYGLIQLRAAELVAKIEEDLRNTAS